MATAQEVAAGQFHFHMAPGFVAHTLATDLYQDIGACLYEILRNGWTACMPSNRWTPSSVHVEISLIDHHPLCPTGRSLVIMDHGQGFTDENVRRFCMIGEEDQDALSARHHGASQKRTGKFAAFGMNDAIQKNRNYASGFYIMSRTSETGRVMKVHITPSNVASGQAMPVFINPDASELGEYARYKGKFTIILIQETSFAHLDEIRDALRWYLPRKQDRAIKVLVGGKPLIAPKLSPHSKLEEGIEAYLERVHLKDSSGGGIRLVDAETGLMCANASKLGSYLPYPLARPDLIGDIFIPGLLQHQTTDRSGIKQSHLRSKFWREKVDPALQLRIAPFALQLLGEEAVFQAEDRFDRTIRSLAKLFETHWGEPDQITNHRPPRPPGQRPPSGPSTGSRPPNGGPKDPDETEEVKHHGIRIKVDGKTYLLRKMVSMDPYERAQLQETTQTIFLNPNYRAFPGSDGALMEHEMIKVLEAIACNAFRFDTRQAGIYASKLMAGLREKK
ncbi:hypothetical protein KBC54_01845 [Patescibacteria group bacterium]|nr:hypothetical protein [Patescibacteria group bacterium]